MGTPLITVTSVTYALRGQRLLASFGIRSKISRTKNRSSEKGCSYSISVPAGKFDEAEEILKKHGIKIIGRTERTDGS
ncbi:MAG: DUF3343 domain-containing protein [Clostridia bacterium]|nr:DUF3343 domain-containing protein [Clostridia bacterium]